MLRTESVSNFIENKLNQVAERLNLNYKFKLFAELGDNKPSGEIKGIITAKKSQPIKNKYYIDALFPYSCEILVVKR